MLFQRVVHHLVEIFQEGEYRYLLMLFSQEEVLHLIEIFRQVEHHHLIKLFLQLEGLLRLRYLIGLVQHSLKSLQLGVQ